MDNAALFTTFPGYLGGPNPAAATDWTAAGGPTIGVNGTLAGMHDAFGPTDNSAATTWGFLQGVGTSYSQTITLSANTNYDFSFLAGNRFSDMDATGRVTIADNATTFYDSTSTNWGNTVFQLVNAQFMTGAMISGDVVLTLSNTSPAGDNTVNYSNLILTAVPEPNSFSLFFLGGIGILMRRRKSSQG
ncbi:MAG: PEP-CTERM sorting domain-containing protein [Planctomycetota bacterium]